MSERLNVKNSRIYLSPPHMGGAEQKYISAAFDSNWIAPLGPNLDQFERQISEYTRVQHVAALSSGTAALHLALILCNVRPGDKVICQSLTFSATINPVRYLHAVPILIDSERDTWNIDPNLLENAILDCGSSKPKAIIPVHLYGMPAKMDQILEIGEKYGIPIIEDAAEALGAKYRGKQAGSLGDMSVISFNGNKIITTSGGGALLSDDEELIKKARYLSTQARDPAPHYQHSLIGYNYRMSNVVAGIGRGQMEVIDQRVQRKREIFEFYEKNLGQYEGVSFLEEPGEEFYSNRWLTTILIDSAKTGFSRMNVQDALESENIESRPLWKPMHLQPVFKDHPAYISGVSEQLFNTGLCLPSGTAMKEEDLNRVLKTIKGMFQ